LAYKYVSVKIPPVFKESEIETYHQERSSHGGVSMSPPHGSE